jgi:hypothetical protein
MVSAVPSLEREEQMKTVDEKQMEFLRKLKRWDGAATPQELGPQISQDDNRHGLVTYDGHYWRLTETGHAILRMRGIGVVINVQSGHADGTP